MRYYFSCMVLSSDCKAHHNNMTWFVFNTLRPLQNYCQISDGIFQNAFYLKKSLVFGKIAMGFVHRVLIDNKSALVVPVIARHHTYLIMYLFVNSLKVSLYTIYIYIYIYICTNKLHSTYYCIVCILLPSYKHVTLQPLFTKRRRLIGIRIPIINLRRPSHVYDGNSHNNKTVFSEWKEAQSDPSSISPVTFHK